MRYPSRRPRDLQEAQLARLADGSLPEPQRARLRAQTESSPQLAADLAAQERALRLIGAFDEPAPASLHDSVRTMIDDSTAAAAAGAAGPRLPARRPRRGMGIVTVGAVLLVAVLVAARHHTPSLGQTVHLALASSTMAAPAQTPSGDLDLVAGGTEIRFPSWSYGTGWRATGARSDTIGDRRVTTVFYASTTGRRVGYAIVSGAPLAVPDGTRVVSHGVTFVVAHSGSITAITWVRAQHTCVVAGRWVSAQTMLALAATA